MKNEKASLMFVDNTIACLETFQMPGMGFRPRKSFTAAAPPLAAGISGIRVDFRNIFLSCLPFGIGVMAICRAAGAQPLAGGYRAAELFPGLMGMGDV